MDRVTASEYARMAGKAISTVQKAVQTGRVRRGADGLISVAEADAYWRTCAAPGRLPADPVLAQLQMRKWNAQADLLELQAARTLGEVVRMADVATAWGAAVRTLRARLALVAPTVAAAVGGDAWVAAEVDRAIGEVLLSIPTTPQCCELDFTETPNATPPFKPAR